MNTNFGAFPVGCETMRFTTRLRTSIHLSARTLYSSPKNIIIGIALLVTLLRLFLIHHYVDWRFLWGGDQVPVLNAGQLLKSIFTFKQPWRDLGILFIPQLSIILITYIFIKIFTLILKVSYLSSNMPGWLVNSLWFFTGSILLWYVISSLKYVNKRHKIMTFFLLDLFFAFNPWSTIDTFKSYLGSTSIQAFLNFIIIAFYFRLMRAYSTSSKIKSYEIMLILAATIMIYGTSPSAAVRGMVILIILEAIFIIFMILQYILGPRKTANFSNIGKILLKSIIPLTVISMLVAIYLLSGYIGPLKARVAASWGSSHPPSYILHPPYATILNSLLGMTSWIAHSQYMPYHEIYETGIVAALMLLWPILSLGGLFLIITMRKPVLNKADKAQLLVLIILGIASIVWGTALNPPFTALKKFAVSKFPYIVKVLPWGISTNFLKFVYLIGTSYVIGYLFAQLSIYRERHNARTKYILLTLISITIIFALLVTALPILNGRVFAQYYNESIKGFYLPKDYKVLYSINTRYYEHILLLPLTPIYAATKWGVQASVGWYHTLNYAVLTRTIAPYSQYTEWNIIYNTLGRPCITTNGYPITKYVDINKVRGTNTRIVSINITHDGTINLTLIPLINGEKSFDIILPMKTPLNISSYKALEINITVKGHENVTVYPRLFIYSGKIAGIHILPGIKPPGEVVKTYVVGEPDKPWPSSKYNPARITGLILRLNLAAKAFPKPKPIEIYLKVVAGNNVALCKSYRKLLDILNIKYIVVDRSLNSYNKFYKLVESALKKEYKLIYNGSCLAIYYTGFHTSPFHIIKPLNVSVKILENKAYHIRAKLITLNESKKVLIVVPLLYAKNLPEPLEVSASMNGKPLRVTSLDYKGLRGYIIQLSNGSSFTLDIHYSLQFKIVYIMFVSLNLMPLLFLFLSLIRYLRESSE